MSNKLQDCWVFIRALHEPAPALFLDRDGVVIEDGHYLCDPDQVRICRGARELIAEAHRYGWPVVVITNQSGISRGLFSWTEVDQVNVRMRELLGPDAPLAAIYANGHGPNAPTDCWRKPSPQMLLEASIALNLDLQRSLLIGDRLSDLQAGQAAGVAMLFHVLSRRWRCDRASVIKWHHQFIDASIVAYSPSCCSPALVLLETLDDFPFPLLEQVKPTLP